MGIRGENISFGCRWLWVLRIWLSIRCGNRDFGCGYSVGIEYLVVDEVEIECLVVDMVWGQSLWLWV